VRAESTLLVSTIAALALASGCAVATSAVVGDGSVDSGVSADSSMDTTVAMDSSSDTSSPDSSSDSSSDSATDTAVVPDGGAPCPAALGADCAWQWRVRLTFDNSMQAEDLVDFPILVEIDSTILDYGQTRGGGEDLRFVDASLSAVLPHEVEVWDEAGTSHVWVGVPRIAANATTDHIWMYYGDPAAPDSEDAAAVWDSSFEMVWHLSGGPTDTSGAGNDGTNIGTTDAVGRIGRAREFDGVDQYIDSAYATDLPEMTVEAWAYGDAAPRADENVAIVGRDTNYQLNWDHFGEFIGAFGLRTGSEWLATSYLPVSGTTWYYLVGTYDGETLRAYRDGAEASRNETPSGPPDADTYPVRLGVNPEPSSGWFFDGRIDEVRISNGVRSAAWIRAQHLSMTNALITYGTPEPVTP